MVKSMVVKLAIVLSLVFSFASSVVAQDNEILINVPQKVKSGNEFLIIINVPENYMFGISRVQIKLPDGFTAVAKQKENARFKFVDQKATFQWLNFPKNREVEISLSVTAAATMEGHFVIKGIASWMESTEPLHANITPQIVTVLKGDMTEEALLMRQENTKISFKEFESEGVACIRQVPYEKDGAVIVNIMVSKGDFSRYGKIQEKIPAGFRVENIKSKNAIFVYNEQQRVVKYMWMKMPTSSKFIVSYKLIPIKDINDSNPFMIFGSFYYAVNNQTKVVDIQERGIDLELN